jgi:hypothetical protein
LHLAAGWGSVVRGLVRPVRGGVVTTLRCRRGCFRGALAALALGLLGGAVSPPAGTAAPAVVERHAPLVWLHQTEPFWPMSASGFVERSSLGWSRRSGCPDTLVAARGEVDAGRLGAGAVAHGGPYRESITRPRPSTGRDLCLPGAFSRAAHDHTRPATKAAEGFYLDLANSDRQGAEPRCPAAQPRCDAYGQAPVYFQYAPGRYVTYWYFFGYSTPLTNGVAGHEGDWERVSVRLDASNRPTEVAYFAHDGDPTTANRKIFGWRELVENGSVKQGHPIVFVARKTHASFPKCRNLIVVKLCGTDRVGAGWLWTTSRHLRDVTVQPWYGFGGAWGSVSRLSAKFTGPEGPGPNGLHCKKPPVPRVWLPKGACD